MFTPGSSRAWDSSGERVRQRFRPIGSASRRCETALNTFSKGPSDHSNPVQFEAASSAVGRAAICLETVNGDSVNSILPALLDFRAVCEVTHAASKESVSRRTEGHRRVRRQDKSRPLAGCFCPSVLRLLRTRASRCAAPIKHNVAERVNNHNLSK